MRRGSEPRLYDGSVLLPLRLPPYRLAAPLSPFSPGAVSPALESCDHSFHETLPALAVGASGSLPLPALLHLPPPKPRCSQRVLSRQGTGDPPMGSRPTFQFPEGLTPYLTNTLPSPNPSNQLLLAPPLFLSVEPSSPQLASWVLEATPGSSSSFPYVPVPVSMGCLRPCPFLAQLPSPHFGPSLTATQARTATRRLFSCPFMDLG